MLTPADRELLREKLIQECASASRAGLPLSTLIQKAVQAGYEITGSELEKELRYVEEKGFVREVAKAISPEVRRYIATPAGTDFLALKGLI